MSPRFRVPVVPFTESINVSSLEGQASWSRLVLSTPGPGDPRRGDTDRVPDGNPGTNVSTPHTHTTLTP